MKSENLSKTKQKEAKLIAQFETKSQKASELIARADEKEKEASARAETLRAAADAATAETKTLEARIKALEGGGSEALKAAVDAYLPNAYKQAKVVALRIGDGVKPLPEVRTPSTPAPPFPALKTATSRSARATPPP